MNRKVLELLNYCLFEWLDDNDFEIDFKCNNSYFLNGDLTKRTARKDEMPYEFKWQYHSSK